MSSLIGGLVLGITSWWIFSMGVWKLLCRQELKQHEKEMADYASRIYQTYDAAEELPVGKRIYYECSVCGGVIPSVSRRGGVCTCKNIQVEAKFRGVKIRARAKVKVFSLGIR